MKLKEITDWSERWSTPLGTMEAHAPVADGVLVGLSLWGTQSSVSQSNAQMENIRVNQSAG
jgi:hypothetical protein